MNKNKIPIFSPILPSRLSPSRLLLLTGALAIGTAIASADYADEANALEMRGDRQGAIAILEEAKNVGNHDAELYLGRMAYRNYEFDKARSHYAAYSNQRKKASEHGLKLLSESERQLSDAKGFMERVEKITIIDSIAVDADSFFKAYRLPVSAGALLPADSIPFADRRDDSVMVFANENRDFMMWCEADSTGYTRLAESIRLTDGKWNTPTLAPETLNGGGNADFPFMMADGTTLYYANDGEESIGGLDIFIATRDAATGEYLQPQNIGMPYNSPYDDYLLAIDELNGIGWWATDRNRLGDKVTVYVFMVNDIRKNYDSEELEEDEILDYAMIRNWRDTQEEEDAPRIEEALAAVKSINPEQTARRADFHFPIGGGREYTTLDDFPDQTSRSMMKQYLATQKEYDSLAADLDAMRREYHERPSKAQGAEISRLEKEEAAAAEKLRKARSEVYRALRR